jgi:hypothetical protein
MMARMTLDPEGPVPDAATVTRLGENGWRTWREVRLTALVDSPAAFGSAVEDERAITEDRWREMVRDAAWRNVGRASLAGPWGRRAARGRGRYLEPIRGRGDGRVVGARR